MLLFISLTEFMHVVSILLVKISFKTYLSSLSLILTHGQLEPNCFNVPEHGQVTKVARIIAPIECHSGYRYFQ